MSDIKAIVHARNAQVGKLFHENKIAELADGYTTDGKLMPGGQPIVVERQGIKDFFQKEREGADGCRILAEEIQQLNDETVLDRGKYTFLKGDHVLDDGKYVVILKKIDEKWQAYIDIFNSDRS